MGKAHGQGKLNYLTDSRKRTQVHSSSKLIKMNKMENCPSYVSQFTFHAHFDEPTTLSTSNDKIDNIHCQFTLCDETQETNNRLT
jgi:hypothetical protein